MDPISWPPQPQLDGATHTDDRGKIWIYTAEWNLWRPLIEIAEPQDPVLNHNDLINVDGGTPGEYFHLTQQEYNDLQTMLGGGAGILARRHAYWPLPGRAEDYCGTAPFGSLTSSPVWNITRITIADNGTVTAVDVAQRGHPGEGAVRWDDWATELYY